MSLSRQQRRKMAREIAKAGNVADGLKVIEDRAMKATDGAIEQLRKEEVERAKGEMQGQMFTLVLAYARIKKGYGHKRLEVLANEFFEFCDDMMLNGVKVVDLWEVIKDETGLDCSEFYKKLDADHIERLREIRKRRKQHDQERHKKQKL
jgi:hypothetical protein